ncbi:hypothetical protein O6H91_17G040600 [Diphasiastrum complanatum]|nr:hypothetical protein O6H91_17G040600 [Diphasiastrum complanatum]
MAAAPCSHTLTLKTVVGKKRNVRVQASKESVEVDERIIAALGYLLPFLDGVQYGRFLFMQFPATQALLQPFLPLLGFYKTYPFASVVAFFTLYLVVVRNPNFSRYVRFNTMQAVVLDVLLIIPSLIEHTIPADGGIGYDVLVSFYNTVFLYLVACFVFGFSSCLLGKTPRLPLVADAADAQVF